jgi:hypothetical protein
LKSDRVSAVGVAVALLLGLLPAGLLFVESAGTRADLETTVRTSAGITLEKSGIADAAAFDGYQRQAQAELGPSLARYLDGGAEGGTVGPFVIDSINSSQPGGPATPTPVAVGYMSNLATRVDVLQGVLPKRGTAGAEGTASMAQPVADRAGIRLFDTVCVRAQNVPTAQPWCARIVGLWQPTSASDPRWTGANAGLTLFTERDQFFPLAAQPSLTITGARQFRPVPAAIATQEAATVAQRVRDLRSTIGASGDGQVRTTLDAELDRFAASRDAASFPVRVLTAALIPLLVLLSGIFARWYVELRIQDLALLRVRGWSEGRVRWLVLLQFGVLGISALALVVLGLLVLVWRAESSPAGFGQVAPSQSELVGIAVAAGVPLAAAASFVWLAWWAARQSVLRLDHPEARLTRSLSWRGAHLNSILIVPAALLLLVPRLAGLAGWPAGGTTDIVTLVLSIGGLVMLIVAALPAMSAAAEARTRHRDDVEATLARWQLRRWWQRHGSAGFLIVLAFTTASFAAVAFATDHAASLAIGYTTALAAGLLAYGLVLVFACRSRTDDYTSLLVDGLSAAAVRRSLRIEQHTVLAGGLIVGLVLGLVLAWATSPGSFASTSSAVTGALVAAAIAVLTGLTVAWLVRRSAVGFHLVEQSRRVT